jgi:Tfp pilus assembly protein PilF
MSDVKARLPRAVTLHQQGRLAEAERSYRDILSRAPEQFDALNLLDAVRAQDAVASFDRSLTPKRDFVEALFQPGRDPRQSRQGGNRARRLRSALAVAPNGAEALERHLDRHRPYRPVSARTAN